VRKANTKQQQAALHVQTALTTRARLPAATRCRTVCVMPVTQGQAVASATRARPTQTRRLAARPPRRALATRATRGPTGAHAWHARRARTRQSPGRLHARCAPQASTRRDGTGARCSGGCEGSQGTDGLFNCWQNQQPNNDWFVFRGGVGETSRALSVAQVKAAMKCGWIGGLPAGGRIE